MKPAAVLPSDSAASTAPAGALAQPGQRAAMAALIVGALVISLVSLILNVLTGAGNTKVRFERRGPPKGPGGDGPVIDV